MNRVRRWWVKRRTDRKIRTWLQAEDEVITAWLDAENEVWRQRHDALLWLDKKMDEFTDKMSQVGIEVKVIKP